MGRENELYRDKIEVSLDGRQIFSLFFAGAVIVCAVFVIGVVVGKRVEARAHVDRAGGGASGDPLAALDRLEADAPLSFRRTLRGGAAAGGSVDAEIAAMAGAQKAAQGEPTPPGKPAAAAHVASGEEAQGETAGAKLDAKAEAKKHADEAKELKKAEEAAKAEAKKAEEARRAEAKKAEELEAKAQAKVDAEAKKAEAKKAEVKSDKPNAEGDKDKSKKSKYTLQLSSFQERGEAETFLSELRSAGYSAFVVPAEVEGKGTFYRVRLGTYPSYEDAVAAKVEFERKISRIAYVTKL